MKLRTTFGAVALVTAGLVAVPMTTAGAASYDVNPGQSIRMCAPTGAALIAA